METNKPKLCPWKWKYVPSGGNNCPPDELKLCKEAQKKLEEELNMDFHCPECGGQEVVEITEHVVEHNYYLFRSGCSRRSRLPTHDYTEAQKSSYRCGNPGCSYKLPENITNYEELCGFFWG